METRLREIAYVDCLEKRKWKTLEKKWQFCTELQIVYHMKRYCKADGDEYEYLTGDIIFENDDYVIEYNDMIIENVKLYEKVIN